MSKLHLPLHKRLCRTPLEELWNDNEVLEARKLNYVTSGHIREIMRREPVIFVVASAGYKLEWYEGNEAFSLWSKAKNHICDNLGEGCSLDDFEGGYFYFAVEWRLMEASQTVEASQAVIVLEHHH